MINLIEARKEYIKNSIRKELYDIINTASDYDGSTDFSMYIESRYCNEIKEILENICDEFEFSIENGRDSAFDSLHITQKHTISYYDIVGELIVEMKEEINEINK